MWEERDTDIQKFGFLKEAFYAYHCIYVIKKQTVILWNIIFFFIY